MWDLRPSDKLERELLVVKGEREDGPGRRPGADHEMVDGHLVVGYGDSCVCFAVDTREGTSTKCDQAVPSPVPSRWTGYELKSTDRQRVPASLPRSRRHRQKVTPHDPHRTIITHMYMVRIV